MNDMFINGAGAAYPITMSQFIPPTSTRASQDDR
jgi:hypothetical protein